jgi:hypothetical protein
MYLVQLQFFIGVFVTGVSVSTEIGVSYSMYRCMLENVYNSSRHLSRFDNNRSP